MTDDVPRPTFRAGATARERLISIFAAYLPHGTPEADRQCACGKPDAFPTPEALADQILGQHVREEGIRLFNLARSADQRAGEDQELLSDLAYRVMTAVVCTDEDRLGLPRTCFGCRRPLGDHERLRGYCGPCHQLNNRDTPTTGDDGPPSHATADIRNEAMKRLEVADPHCNEPWSHP